LPGGTAEPSRGCGFTVYVLGWSWAVYIITQFGPTLPTSRTFAFDQWETADIEGENSGKIASSSSDDEEHADDVNNSLSSTLMMNGMEKRILSLLLL